MAETCTHCGCGEVRPARLGAILADARGAGDAFLATLAGELAEMGYRLGGVVQDNSPVPGDCRCDMTLVELTTGRAIRISQDLGDQARGCRLDSNALEEVAGLVEASVGRELDLVIVNKFGKREAEGAGLRQAIQRFVDAGVPVLVGVAQSGWPAWQAFSGDMAVTLPADKQAVIDWLG